jgi:hypothetical protein
VSCMVVKYVTSTVFSLTTSVLAVPTLYRYVSTPRVTYRKNLRVYAKQNFFRSNVSALSKAST